MVYHVKQGNFEQFKSKICELSLVPMHTNYIISLKRHLNEPTVSIISMTSDHFYETLERRNADLKGYSGLAILLDGKESSL